MAQPKRTTGTPGDPVNSDTAVRPEAVVAGVVGLGLMGTSIVAALLAAGHRVIGVTRSITKRADTRQIVLERLKELKDERLLAGDPDEIVGRLEVTEDYGQLQGCQIVIESILEDPLFKREVLARIEANVNSDAIIGTNTSALPVTLLQKDMEHPERLLGIHWAEPAHVTRFMEIICGDQTGAEFAERAVRLAGTWGKEPTLVRRDIRGFITNRIMYAMLREAFYLVENGYATPADVDRSVRNDMGCWMTLAGPFRFMDLTGIPAYRAVMEDLLPELCNGTNVPRLMQGVVDSGALGVANAKGFYSYTPEQAKRWQQTFLQFSYDIRSLAQSYPESVAD